MRAEVRFSQRYLHYLKILFIGVFGFLTYLLLIELAPEAPKYSYEDKVQHVLAFGGVALVGMLAFPTRRCWLVMALVLYGGLMECMQYLLTTTRHASVLDWLADAVGVALAYGLAYLLEGWRKGRVNG